MNIIILTMNNKYKYKPVKSNLRFSFVSFFGCGINTIANKPLLKVHRKIRRYFVFSFAYSSLAEDNISCSVGCISKPFAFRLSQCLQAAIEVAPNYCELESFRHIPHLLSMSEVIICQKINK
jgi:hypothetical protein